MTSAMRAIRGLTPAPVGLQRDARGGGRTIQCMPRRRRRRLLLLVVPAPTLVHAAARLHPTWTPVPPAPPAPHRAVEASPSSPSTGTPLLAMPTTGTPLPAPAPAYTLPAPTPACTPRPAPPRPRRPPTASITRASPATPVWPPGRPATTRALRGLRTTPTTVAGPGGRPAPPFTIHGPFGAGPYRFTAAVAGAAAGQVRVHLHGPAEILITDLAVTPKHRGAGVGGALMHAAMHLGARLGRTRAILEADDDGTGRLVRWYGRLGFRRAGLGSHGQPRLVASLTRRVTR